MLSSGGKHSPSCCQMLPVMNVWGNHNSLRTSLTPPYPPAPSVRSISKRKARVCCNGCLPSFAPFTSAPASVWQQFNSLPCVVSLVPSGGISKGKSRILLMHAGTVRVQFCIMPLLLFSPLTPALHYLTGSFKNKIFLYVTVSEGREASTQRAHTEVKSDWLEYCWRHSCFFWVC